MTQVSIAGSNHTVTVDHEGADLVYVVEKAQKLWDETKPAEHGPGPAIGFSSEIHPQWDHDNTRPVRA